MQHWGDIEARTVTITIKKKRAWKKAHHKYHDELLLSCDDVTAL